MRFSLSTIALCASILLVSLSSTHAAPAVSEDGGVVAYDHLIKRGDCDRNGVPPGYESKEQPGGASRWGKRACKASGRGRASTGRGKGGVPPGYESKENPGNASRWGKRRLE